MRGLASCMPSLRAFTLVLLAATSVEALMPDDPHFSSQWHLTAINAPTAWDIPTSGQQIVIAMIDDCVTEIAELAGRLVAGYDFFNHTAGCSSSFSGHATAAATVAAALTNNGIGIAGVTGPGTDIKVMPLRVVDRTGFANASRIVRAIDYARMNGAHVIHINVNRAHTVRSVRKAAQHAIDAGSVVIAPAGNRSSTVACLDSANVPEMISVSGLQQSNGLFWETAIAGLVSECGPYVDVAAPATTILTAFRDGSYVSFFGTSFAGPIVAGVAAYMRAVNPMKTPAEIEWAIKSTARDLSSTGRNGFYGYGRIDMEAAVKAIVPTLPKDNGDTAQEPSPTPSPAPRRQQPSPPLDEAL